MYESAQRNSVQWRRCMFTQTPARWHRLSDLTPVALMSHKQSGVRNTRSLRVFPRRQRRRDCVPRLVIFVSDVFVIMRYELQTCCDGRHRATAPEKAPCQMPATGISCYFCPVGHGGSKIKTWIPKELSVGWSGHGSGKTKSMSLYSLLFWYQTKWTKYKWVNIL